MSYDSLVILRGEDLRYLAEIIYRREAEVIKSQPFNSSIERNKFLDDCKVTYDAVLDILKYMEELYDKYVEDVSKGPIAHQMFSYVEHGVNVSLQVVRNYSVRVSFLTKLQTHTDSLVAELHHLDSEVATDVEKLAAKAAKYNDVMIKCLENYKNPVSAAFSRWVKSSRMTFDQLLKRYMPDVGYKGSFESLEEAQKIEVYDEILRASGRGNIFKIDIKEVGAAAVLLLAAGIMVWDIFTAEHKTETAFRDAAVTAASISGGMLGDVVQAVVRVALADVVEGATYFAMGVGLLVSFAGAFIIGAFAGVILDLIFSSGGTATLSTDGIKCYVAPMPDGAVLARQISHDKKIC
ncbi:hypothetical protein LguiA_021895 [Lonicera macranthoides]